jgi:hypothetical protein
LRSHTSTGTAWHTLSRLSVCSSAGILLDAGAGNTAVTGGNRATGVLARENTCIPCDASGGNGGKAEDDGGNGELHLDGLMFG